MRGQTSDFPTPQRLCICAFSGALDGVTGVAGGDVDVVHGYCAFFWGWGGGAGGGCGGGVLARVDGVRGWDFGGGGGGRWWGA